MKSNWPSHIRPASRWPRSLWRSALAFTFGAMLSACSLLEVKLESGIEPLPQEQLNMRLFSRDFSQTFFIGVEHAADDIARLAKNDEAASGDISIRSNTLMWKINAEEALSRSIYQSSPVAAMVDTWALTAQMNAFFCDGSGQQLFGEHQGIAIKASEQLQRDFETTVQGFVSKSDFNKHRKFINQYIASQPLPDISFARQTAFQSWLKYNEISEFEAVTTFGTLPEVMSDISDRMAMISEQMPKILGWKAELYALHSNINSEEVQRTLASIADTSAKFQVLMAQSPEMMQSLAVDLRRELTPLLNQLSSVTDDKMAQLSSEREALTIMVKNERLAIEEMIARERIAAAADLEHISQMTVAKVFDELGKLLQDLILYIILFIMVVVFVPLFLGIWLGKRMQQRSDSAAPQ
ncbi:chemotaxis protein [Shewanella waksmanii]|uniref:chemotaxis protein n=1 Tax=Shewanella waksmanii TaxID=213783 RepID=UPI0004ACDF86|nr:chemotaxis protein [Shewanella waksmanii]